jgi:hypothetical protein
MKDILFYILVLLILCNIIYFILNCKNNENFYVTTKVNHQQTTHPNNNANKSVSNCHAHKIPKSRHRCMRNRPNCYMTPPPNYHMESQCLPPQNQCEPTCDRQREIDNAIKDINKYCKRQESCKPTKPVITECVKKCETYKPTTTTQPLPTRCHMECNPIITECIRKKRQ